MANFDAAAGIDTASLNGLLSQFYQVAEQTAPGNNPFDGNTVRDIAPLGNTKVTWKLGSAPSLVFGAPTSDAWNAALDENGNTNLADGIPLPTEQMVQITIATMSASYATSGQPPIGGQTSNVVAYATLTFPAGEVDVAMVGLVIDEKDFKAWDQVIFNSILVPAIFGAVVQMLGIIHVPSLHWEGVALAPLQFSVINNQRLIAASTLAGSSKPVDIGGVTWPSDPVFVLASSPLINAALAAGVQSEVGKTFSDSGDYKSLADWDYQGSLDSITASVDTLAPLTVNAALTASLNVGGKLTAAGMAIAAVGCALGGALLVH